MIPDDTLAKFPPVYLITTDLDPCLDETISFSNRFSNLGKFISLDVVSGLPHGFLGFNRLFFIRMYRVSHNEVCYSKGLYHPKILTFRIKVRLLCFYYIGTFMNVRQISLRQMVPEIGMTFFCQKHPSNINQTINYIETILKPSHLEICLTMS